jgi:hypothetical protein
MKKKYDFVAGILSALPSDFNNLSDKHIKKLQNSLKLENHEIPIEKVNFKFHKYNRFM